MSKLDLESRMTIKTMLAKGVGASEVARLLEVSEGVVRYHARRMQCGAVDGRSPQPMKAEAVAEAIGHWRESQGDAPLNLAGLHEWLNREDGYGEGLRSVQRFWNRTYPRPQLRARRRVETPPGRSLSSTGRCFRASCSGTSPPNGQSAITVIKSCVSVTAR
jgi:hypothetical protein